MVRSPSRYLNPQCTEADVSRNSTRHSRCGALGSGRSSESSTETPILARSRGRNRVANSSMSEAGTETRVCWNSDCCAESSVLVSGASHMVSSTANATPCAGLPR